MVPEPVSLDYRPLTLPDLLVYRQHLQLNSLKPQRPNKAPLRCIVRGHLGCPHWE